MTRFSPAYDRDGEPITMERWGELHADLAYLHVRATVVGEAEISTVWMGIDHNFSGEGPPIIFETMVFDGEMDGYQWRYATEAEAIAGHDEVVERVRAKVTNGG